MKFLANENFPLQSFKFLKDNQLDIEHMSLIHPGDSDEQVMERAIQEQRIIITFDRDYGDFVYRLGHKPPGVVYLRFKDFEPLFPGHLMLELLDTGSTNFEGFFTVIDSKKLRQSKI